MKKLIVLFTLISSMSAAQGYEKVWEDAQNILSNLPHVNGDPYSVDLEDFDVERKMDKDYCGSRDYKTLGCFRAEGKGTLWYAVDTKNFTGFNEVRRIMVHEACHAILWKLNDGRWQVFDHVVELKLEKFR